MAEKLSILLIEDDIHDVEAVERALKTVQPSIFLLHHVPKFRDAIRAIREKPFHVVILDLGLPDSVGLNGVERLMALIPTLPVIVLTGMDDDATALKGIELGAQEFLDKNHVTPQQLIRTIRHATKRKQFSIKAASRGTPSERGIANDQPVNQSAELENLSEIMQETNDLVCAKTTSLMKTGLTDEQRSLVSDIEKSSQQSLESLRTMTGQQKVASDDKSDSSIKVADDPDQDDAIVARSITDDP